MAVPAFESRGETPQGESIEEYPPPSTEPVEQPPESDRTAEKAAKGASIAAGLLVVGTLLPWLSVTFFSSASLSGVRLAEGRFTLLLAFLAGVFAVTAIFTDRRGPVLAASAVLGAATLIPIIIFAFRYRDALDLGSLGTSPQIQQVASAGTGLESGWYLALAAAVALTLISLWGVVARRGEAGSVRE